jgi:hypothetical protein
VNSVVRRWAAAILWTGISFAQPAIHFKTRTIRREGARVSIVRPFHGDREHLVLEFESPPPAETIAELRERGASVLQHVPENGLLVFVDRPVRVAGLGVRSMFPIDPADKISPLVNDAGRVLVEFHPDTDMNAARGIVLQTGATLDENPDLNPHHLLVDASAAQIAELARRDEVAYIFPASPALLQGNPTQPCLGAVTSLGTTAQSIPSYGSWNQGGAAAIGYVFSQLAGELSASQQESEIERAMAQWAAVVQVTWQQGTNATAPQTVNILFTTGDHGDGYPFGPAGGVLAHTFYPSPPNPEPIAGDMHFNNANTFRAGANVDVFSVALHELGHALGLGHSDDPNAVMYPYYSMHGGLSPMDITAVQTLYAARTAPSPTPRPAPPPLTLSVAPPPATTTAGTISLTGTASGGKAAATVTWSSSLGSGAAQGSAAWTISGIPLSIGANSILVSATDGVSRVAQTVSITRQAGSSPAQPGAPGGTAPPSLTITTPSATSISTAASSIVFAGIAGAGVTSVTWSTNTGHSGTASGTTQWSATIPLVAGSNAVIIQAQNAAGQSAWRSVVVTRQ